MSRSELLVSSPAPTAQVTVFNHSGEIVAQSSGNLKVYPAPGIYRIQVEVGASSSETFVSVESGETVRHFPQVKVPAVTPVAGTTTHHEYHSGPAQQLSMDPTAVRGTGSRLVVFIRVVSTEKRKPRKRLPGGLRLLTSDYEELTPTAREWATGPGFAAFSVELDPGCYLLRSESSTDPVQADQSVTTVAGWTTMAFVPVWPSDDEPDVVAAQALVVHMNRSKRPFEPYDFGSHAVFAAEMALDGLRNGQVVMPDRGWTMLDRQELEVNPMLGMYVGHALLGSRQPPFPRLGRLVRDLRALLPDHPDADALFLALKSAKRDKSMTRMAPVATPPMLRASYDALVERDATQPGLVLDGSMAELAASVQRQDGVWARWDALPELSQERVTDAALVDGAARALAGLVDDLPTTDRQAGDTSVEADTAVLAELVTQMSRHRDQSSDDERRISIAELSVRSGCPSPRCAAT